MNQVHDVIRHEGGEAVVHSEDPCHQHGVIRALERRPPNHHLVKKDPEAPNVQVVVMARHLDHLRGQVVQGPTKSCSWTGCLCTPSKVRNLKDIVVIHQQILWFQITVDDLQGVQVLEPTRNLQKVVPCNMFRETATLACPQKLIKLSLRAVLEKQKYAVGVLEVLEETKDVLVPQALLNLNLPFDLVDQITFDDLSLVHGLQCEDLQGVLSSHAAHNPKGALPQRATSIHVQYLKVVKCDSSPRSLPNVLSAPLFDLILFHVTLVHENELCGACELLRQSLRCHASFGAACKRLSGGLPHLL